MMRHEGQSILEELAEKTKKRREEVIAMKERLESAIEKVDQIMDKAENVKRLDLEAKSGDDKIDTSNDDATIKKQLEEAEKERKEMYKMIDELTSTEIHGTKQRKPHRFL